LREAIQGTPAARHHGRCRRPALVGEEVPGLDLRQPARQLLQILLALLHFGERIFLRPGFPADLFEKSGAALGELVILPSAVGLEMLHDRFIYLRRQARDVEYESYPVQPGNIFPQLLKEIRMRCRIREHPGAIHHCCRPDGSQAAPERHPCAGRRAGKLGQEKQPAC